jgi:hypothetical protein
LAILPAGRDFQVSTAARFRVVVFKVWVSGTNSASAIGEKSDCKIVLPRRSFGILTGGGSA